ncbi:hypothetical protein ACMU6081_26580 [Achromobacter mucicolens]
MRPKASAVVNRMAVHGVWFLRCTCARKDGSTPWRDMPYSRRLAIIMLMSAEFATANIEMIGMMYSTGRSGAARLTTSTSGVLLLASSPTGTSATAQMDTST